MMRVRIPISVLALLLVLALAAEDIRSQTAVCSDTPGAGERIECTENAASTSDIGIDAEAIDIDAVDNSGINVRHEGAGDIDIAVRGRTETDNTVTRSAIDVTGTTSQRRFAVDALHKGIGSVDVRVESTDINNQLGSSNGGGVAAEHDGTGDLTLTVDKGTEIDSTFTGVIGVKNGPGELEVRVQGGSRVSSTGGANGVYGIHTHPVPGDVRASVVNDSVVIVKDSTVSVASAGVRSFRENGAGTARVEVRGSTVTTTGGSGHHAVDGSHNGEGEINVLVEDSTVTTGGRVSFGVWGHHQKAGNVTIRVRDSIIRAESTEESSGNTFSYGIHGRSSATGNIDIDVQGGSVTTAGASSYGIFGRHQGNGVGDITINAESSPAITTTGANAHGILLENRATANTGSMAVRVQGRIDASGAGASGVRIGRVLSGNVDRAAPIDTDGYRQHTVVIHGPVRGGSGEAAGVYLAGGGRVNIWSHGTLRAASGIAILATGDTPGADPANDPPIKPKLLVNMRLAGRRVAQVLGDNWIINDGGETTILVNDIKLHDGATGVVLDGNGDPVEAPNGAFDVSVRPDGVTVNDRSTDPWTISARSTSTIADRDFSAADFKESRKSPPPPPPPPPEPEPEPEPVPEPEPEPEPEPVPEPDPVPAPSGSMFNEEYAPRAALYELLPDFLLRLSGQTPSRRCRATPAKPVWVRFAGGQGAYQADRSTTGATYDFDRFETEGGLSASFNEKVRGWASVRYVRGTAGGASPTGGGEIDARGLGSTVGGAWTGANGAYAVGCFSYMGYTLDFASTNQGLLRGGVNGRAYTLDFEAGRRLAMGEQVHVTPRAWVVGSRVLVGRFTDTVNARVAVADADRVLLGLGVQADTTRPWGEGEFTLRGSVDYERIVSGAETTTTVSGEKLRAEATDNSLLLGLNGVYRQGRFSVGAAVSARQELGSSDTEYVGFLNLGITF